ncbi:hypothetical protein [Nonomuraea sp. NPDC049480]|uniref:hypothetical protein n=1 Tax=Nonomuraea sp. NPDC049480 TaxID=3364353 RepID=UPI0037B056FD
MHIHDGYDDTELRRVYRSGRRWQALAPDGRVIVHRAASRAEAVDQLLAPPDPLFGDPADPAGCVRRPRTSTRCGSDEP